MKRQENPLSSSRRENPPENRQAKSIGCMSGLFHFVSKYQKRRKLLISDRKREIDSHSSPKTPKPSLEESVDQKSINVKEEQPLPYLSKCSPPECDFQRFSCEAPRSQALTVDVIRSNSVNSPENLRRPQTLVARLMGLGEIPVSSPISAYEKRQMLLGAVEKCDQDLKELRKIIESIQLSEKFQLPSPAVDGLTRLGGSRDSTSPKSEFKSHGPKPRSWLQLDSTDSFVTHRNSSDYNGERPSPVSVLDEISSPPFLSKRKKNGEHKKSQENNIGLTFQRRIMATEKSLPRPSGHREDYVCDYFWLPPKKLDCVLGLSCSRAMMESVNEVCDEVSGGEKRELGRIVLAIQDHIFAGLLEEIVGELKCCCLYPPLPFEACRKRLRF